jgi:chorismate-pyruvate lyase
LTKAPPESLLDGASARPSRSRYRDGLPAGTPLATWAEAWLRVLLAQDGSATLLCETIAQGRVALEVTHQQVTTEVPQAVTANLGGRRFLERQVVLHHAGEVMMDNLTFVALDRIDPDVAALLTERRSPIGYIFERKSTKKRPVAPDVAILDRLWSRCGAPDPDAARSYVLDIDDRPCMLITETYRAGMRSGLPVR